MNLQTLTPTLGNISSLLSWLTLPFASGLIAFGTYRSKSLTKNGAIVAGIVASLMGIIAPVAFWSLMLFFISSNLLTRIKGERKVKLEGILDKKGPRDSMQVLANSFPALVALVIYAWSNNPLFLIAALSAIAGSNGDTWSSELGVLSKSKPVGILNFRPQEPGMSGAVTLSGFIWSYLGASLIAAFYLLYQSLDGKAPSFSAFLLISIVGFLCSVIDSILGATLQGKYTTVGGAYTEQRYDRHTRSINRLEKGTSLVSNDVVNGLSSALTALIGILAGTWFL